MKQLLITIAMVLSLSMNAGATAQKHRHTPRTEQVDSTKTKDAIEAFSDTTATADEDAEDDQYISYRRGSSYTSSRDVQELKDVMETVGEVIAPGMIIAIIAIVIMFLVAPILIIITIFYFLNKNRKERYKLAQMAMQNGQPIPDDILKERQDSWDRSDYQTGLRQMFTGVGLAIFLGIVAGKIGFGIGALVFFIGLGKWYISKKSMAGNDSHFNNFIHVNNHSNNQNYDKETDAL